MSSEALPTSAPVATSRRLFLVSASLAAVYFIWGGTFLAIRVALDSFPPLLMSGIRFTVAGAVLFAVARIRGAAMPTAPQWVACGATGGLLVASNAALVFAEGTVPSGVAAMVMATIPMWTAVVGLLWGERTRGGEWIGLGLGLSGVALLHFGGALGSSGIGALVLFLAPVSWATGSIFSRHLPLPGGMVQSAAQMTIGGAGVLLVGLARGERMTAVPSMAGLATLAYLIVFGSIAAFSAYGYLLREVRPSIATSYAYVNPVIALAMGAALGGERITTTALVALAVTLSGVAVIVRARRPQAPPVGGAVETYASLAPPSPAPEARSRRSLSVR